MANGTSSNVPPSFTEPSTARGAGRLFVAPGRLLEPFERRRERRVECIAEVGFHQIRDMPDVAAQRPVVGAAEDAADPVARQTIPQPLGQGLGPRLPAPPRSRTLT